MNTAFDVVNFEAAQLVLVNPIVAAYRSNYNIIFYGHFIQEYIFAFGY